MARPQYDVPGADINLPRPMTVVGELILVQARLLPQAANLLWHARLMLKKPDHAGHVIHVKLLQSLAMMPPRLRPVPTHAWAIQTRQIGNRAIELKLAMRQWLAITAAFHATGSKIFQQRQIVGQMFVISRRLFDRHQLVGIVGENRPCTKGLNGRRRFARIGGDDLLAGLPIHVMDAGQRLSEFVAALATDAIRHFGRGGKISFIRPVDEGLRLHDKTIPLRRFEFDLRDAVFHHGGARQMMPPQKIEPGRFALDQAIEDPLCHRGLVIPAVVNQFPLRRIHPQGLQIFLARTPSMNSNIRPPNISRRTASVVDSPLAAIPPA